MSGKAIEHYYPRVDSTGEPCANCGGPTERLLSRFGIVWTGPITAKYNDRKSEGAFQEGHWAFERKGTIDGKPKPVFIETFDQQRDYCKREGVALPSEMPRRFEVSEDGKHVPYSGSEV